MIFEIPSLMIDETWAVANTVQPEEDPASVLDLASGSLLCAS